VAQPKTKIPGTGPEQLTALKRKLKFSKNLNFITNSIHSARDIDHILIHLTDKILTLFDAERMTIYIVDDSGRELISLLKTGEEIDEIRVPMNARSIAGYCVLHDRIVRIRDAYDREELNAMEPEAAFDNHWDEMTGYRTKQLLSAPIKFNREVMGVIQLLNKVSGKFFTLEDQHAVTEIAKVLGIAFYNHRRLQECIAAPKTRFDYLISGGIITQTEMEKAMLISRRNRARIEHVLTNEFDVPRAEIGKSLSMFYNTRYIPFEEGMVIPGQLLKGLKPAYLKKNLFVPVLKTDSKIVIAMENPRNLPAQDAIRAIIPNSDFEFCVSLKDDIWRMVDHFFDIQKTTLRRETDESIEDILEQLDPQDVQEEEEFAGVSEEDGAIVHLVNKMIVDAHNRGVSDIHIEPMMGRENAVIRFRIDGACQVYQTIPYTYKNALCSRIKIMSDLDISERRLPQDGKINFKKYSPLDIELRVSTVPTTGRNEDVVLRLLSSGEPMPLDRMGMTERNYAAFTEMIQKPYGIVLVAGPTGSGKTTTLHAALHAINRPETKIWTAEDPVEITQRGLRQLQVQPKIGLTFAKAMRAFLRSDPDVIMVGEMRDEETAATAIEASLTGHLVFSTLHTNSATETVTRLLDMGMDPFNFSDALIGILAQRLARVLCEHCKEGYHPSREEYDAIARAYGGHFELLKAPYSDDLTLFRAKGCPQCQDTGYKGRAGVHELLVASPEIKSSIQNRVPVGELKKQAVMCGMTTLMQDGIRKVFEGRTDMMQVRKVCL
jgi:type II secretory ATPase GspE/PulE/Tfp pilus assembly ATPase PilB-like protein